jgi:hypothetical protein
MRRAFLLCLLPLALGAMARAAWPRLPAVAGELTGKFTLPALPAAPAATWTITVKPGAGAARRAEILITAGGAKIQAHAFFDPATGDGTWAIEAGEIDPAVWFPVAAARLGEAMSAAVLTGDISVAGQGALRAGEPSGTVQLTLANGRLVLTKPAIEFSRLALRVTLPRLPALALEGELTFAQARAAGLDLQDGRIPFALGAGGEVQIGNARVRGLGGTLVAAPMGFALAHPVIAAKLTMAGVALEQIVALLPPALSEARGRVDGELVIEWSEATGLHFGAGWLKLAEHAAATVRLTPTPGLITAQLSAGNPAFASLQRVELGQTPLNVRLMSAEFQPAGDALGRTASVHLEAEPIDPQLIAPLVLEINVAGPLDQLIKLGLDDRVRMGGPRG